MGENIKITRPLDLTVAEAILEEAGGEDMTNLRIGHGYDVHRLAAGRKLILAGWTSPMKRGWRVIPTRMCWSTPLWDALLGAAGLEDIGCLFPDSSEEFRGISSLVLLKRVAGELKSGASPW